MKEIITTTTQATENTDIEEKEMIEVLDILETQGAAEDTEQVRSVNLRVSELVFRIKKPAFVIVVI